MSKRVLVAPLHWGLGHASRCIPIIREQLAKGHEVIIAAEGGQKALLLEHFPKCRFISIPFVEITYPADGNMARHFFRNGLKLLSAIVKEHQFLREFLKKERVDLVISDSRFGLWNKSCRCVFVTHQIHIKSPVMQGSINRMNRWIMSKYDEVWIPDFETFPGLAGELSHPQSLPNNAKYIGPLSRFQSDDSAQESEHVRDLIAVISGPEPQRSLFENQIRDQCIEEKINALIVKGQPEAAQTEKIGNIELVNHLDDRRLVEALRSSKKILSRSGYSTIMDLHALGLKAEFHPTPGQTEQQYLAELHS